MRGTHAEKAELEPYRKGLSGESAMIRKSGNFKAFHESVRVLGDDARHGSRRRFRNTNRRSCQRPYLRLAMGWRRRCQPTSSLGI